MRETQEYFTCVLARDTARREKAAAIRRLDMFTVHQMTWVNFRLLRQLTESKRVGTLE